MKNAPNRTVTASNPALFAVRPIIGSTWGRCVAILLVLSLSACSVSPTTQQSRIALLHANGDTADTNQTAHAAVQWWQQFNDPVLNDLIQRAALNNRDIHLALARLQEAQAGLTANRSRLLPTVSLDATASDQKSDLPAPIKQAQPDTRALQVSANLKWELDIFGSNRASTNAAAAQAQAAAWGISAAQLLVISEVVRQYMTWQGATERLRVVQSLLNNQQQTLQRTQRLRQEGLASDFDLSRVQAEISSTQAILPSLRSLQAVSQHRISVLLAENPATPSFQLQAKPIEQWPVLQHMPRQQQIELLQRRPDIRAAEMQLNASSAALAAAKADRFPKFFLNAVWGEQKLRLNALQLATSPYQQIALAFSAPILNRKLIQANIVAKTAKEQQALIQYEQSILQAIEQVENSLVAADNEKQRSQDLAQSRAQRQIALKHAQSLYREGQSGILPVLDVERGLLKSELDFVDSQLQNSLNLVQVYTAMGGGWDQVPLPEGAQLDHANAVLKDAAPQDAIKSKDAVKPKNVVKPKDAAKPKDAVKSKNAVMPKDAVQSKNAAQSTNSVSENSIAPNAPIESQDSIKTTDTAANPSVTAQPAQTASDPSLTHQVLPDQTAPDLTQTTSVATQSHLTAQPTIHSNHSAALFTGVSP